MVNELSFDEEISFKFRSGRTLRDLVLAFCTYFEKANEGRWSNIRKTDLMPEKLTAVEVSRSWVFGGTGIALILFYSEDNDLGRAVVYIFCTNVSSTWAYRPVEGLREQIKAFFDEKSDELILVESQKRLEAQKEERSEETTAQRQPQGWLTPIRFCEKCAAAIAIDESTYCWNCGARLPVREKQGPLNYGEEITRSRPQCDEVEYDRNCMICRLGLKEGQLLAWCPRCGAPAHRIHMLEWLHVKGTCPACGQKLATPELEEQLSQAHFQQPSQAQRPSRATRTRVKDKHGHYLSHATHS